MAPSFLLAGLLVQVIAALLLTSALSTDGARAQFQSVLNPNMCAAGKSNWVDAIGSGPFQLQPCFNKRGRRSKFSSSLKPWL